jgi:hypothetical protein
MRTQPAIDLAELRYGLAFGSSVEELAEFLHRDVENVRHKAAVAAQTAADRQARSRPPSLSNLSVIASAASAGHCTAATSPA